MNQYFRSLGLAAGVAVALVWAMPVRAENDSHGGHMSHGGHDHGAHDHGSASFDAGEPGMAALVTRRIEVVAREGDGKMSFEPKHIAVKKGETVEFTVRNDGLFEHEFVLGSAIENASHAALMEATPDMKHNEPNAVRLAPGSSAKLLWRFSKAGDFQFACLIPGHYEAGMKGAAVVD